ncbi:uncharacterized protein LOC111613564 [Centruroides sculpturatus]|uniref:uncharacterized protein LOC111613564 n=1 Tax=Centruroides sculpturatus TaxID=218467 RepID=UPI000C6DE35D|nr:uncharacterized protein LOC111613564 [Centruroides sculpturatus]
MVKWRGHTSSELTQCRGIPQGSVVSPFLFALFMSDIFKLENNHTLLYVYADDITVIIHENNPTNLRHSTAHFIHSLENWASINDIRFQPQKCAILRIPINIHNNQDISLQGQIIPEVNKIKTLGIFITANLSWNTHVQYIHNKCRKLLNIFKIFCNKNTGGHPTDILCIANSTIGSIITYTIPSIATLTKTQRHTLESIQTQYIKHSLGLPISTNNTVTLRAANKTSLECRFHKCIIKQYCTYVKKATSDLLFHSMIQNIHNNSGASLVKIPFIHFTRSWLLLHNIQPSNLPLKPSSITNASIHNIHLDDLAFQNSNLPDIFIQQSFKEWEEQQNINTIVATDGSKTSNTVTAAFIDKKGNITAHFSLHPEATIFTAEGYAILQAIHHVTHKKEDAIICSDSKSVLKALHAQHEKSSTLIQTINTILNQRHILNLQTKLIWTPAHKGIPINEQADKLAKTNPPTLPLPTILLPKTSTLSSSPTTRNI